MTAARDWHEIVRIASDDAEAVMSEVGQFLDDPGEYFAAHEGDLADRGIESPDDVTGVIVLIDALGRTGELAYLDWKNETEDTIAMLNRLPRVAASPIDLAIFADELSDDGDGGKAADVERVVANANGVLASSRLAIAVLDEDSDAYPLVAIATGNISVLERAAEAVGFRAVISD
ncbi:MAG: DUF6630 family protein [Pseudoclavibacter sp.]